MKLNLRRRSHLRRGEEKGRRGEEGEREEKRGRGGGEGGDGAGGGGGGGAVYIGKFRRNYRRPLIAVGNSVGN